MFVVNATAGMATRGLDEALTAWLAGDAERTLALYGALDRGEADSPPAILLRARALLRPRRTGDAIAVLKSPPLANAAAGDAATAAMLLGTAYARSGDVERGLAILRDAANLPGAADVAI